MASIHGWVWFFVGVLVAGFSKFGPNSGQRFFTVFFYIGVLFIFIGIVKIIFAPSVRRKRILAAQDKVKLGGLLCPNCNAKNFHYSKHCHMCGMRLR